MPGAPGPPRRGARATRTRNRRPAEGPDILAAYGRRPPVLAGADGGDRVRGRRAADADAAGSRQPPDAPGAARPLLAAGRRPRAHRPAPRPPPLGLAAAGRRRRHRRPTLPSPPTP